MSIIQHNNDKRSHGGVLLLNTLDGLIPGFPSRLKVLCDSYGVPLNVYSDEEVSVSLFKHLNGDYDIVLLRLHSTNQYGQTWLFTGEPYDQNKYLLEQLSDQVHRARPYIDEKPYFCITSVYVKVNLDTSVLFLMGCDGMTSQDLSSAFKKSGVETVIGWDGLVDLEYSDTVALEFCDLVLSGASSQEIKQCCLFHDPDPVYHSQLLSNK